MLEYSWHLVEDTQGRLNILQTFPNLASLVRNQRLWPPFGKSGPLLRFSAVAIAP